MTPPKKAPVDTEASTDFDTSVTQPDDTPTSDTLTPVDRPPLSDADKLDAGLEGDIPIGTNTNPNANEPSAPGDVDVTDPANFDENDNLNEPVARGEGGPRSVDGPVAAAGPPGPGSSADVVGNPIDPTTGLDDGTEIEGGGTLADYPIRNLSPVEQEGVNARTTAILTDAKVSIVNALVRGLDARVVISVPDGYEAPNASTVDDTTDADAAELTADEAEGDRNLLVTEP